MGWLRKRFGEATTMAGLGILFAIVVPMVPPQYQLLVQAIGGALGVGSIVRPEAGNR